MIVRCTTCLIFFLEEIVLYLAKNLSQTLEKTFLTLIWGLHNTTSQLDSCQVPDSPFLGNFQSLETHVQHNSM